MKAEATGGPPVRRHRGVARVAALVVLAGVLSAPSGAQARERSSRPPMPSTPPQAGIPTVPISRILTIGKPDLEIGVEDEEGPYLFGMISGIAVGPDGTIYVGDYSVGTVRAFDRTGRHLTTFGRRGTGPGEFSYPPGVRFHGDSTILVPQGPWGVTELGARGGRITYRRTFGKGGSVMSTCARGDSLLVAEWRVERILHVLGPDRGAVRSFGEGWSSDTNDVVRFQTNRLSGRLDCEGGDGSVIVAQGAAAGIRLYERDGTLRWSTVLPDFRYSFALASQGGYALVAGEDQVTTLWRLDAERLLVQVTRATHDARPRPPRGQGGIVTMTPVSTRTYLLSLGTGRILSQSSDAPLLGAIVDGHAYVGIADPYPRVRRFRVGIATR